MAVATEGMFAAGVVGELPSKHGHSFAVYGSFLVESVIVFTVLPTETMDNLKLV